LSHDCAERRQFLSTGERARFPGHLTQASSTPRGPLATPCATAFAAAFAMRLPCFTPDRPAAYN